LEYLLESGRLRYRENVDADAPFLIDLLGDPEVMRFWPRPYTPEEAVAWIARMRARHAEDGYAYWLAEEKASGRPIGQVGLLRQVVEGRTEIGIGYIIHRAFWRRGYAAEGARAMRDYAFDVLRVPRLVTLIRPANIPSLNVVWKLPGMRPEKLVTYADFEHLVFFETAEKAETGPSGR